MATAPWIELAGQEHRTVVGPRAGAGALRLQRLAGEDATLDIKAVQGAPGWFRLRIGDYRVPYRVVEREHDRQFLVRRVVDRRDLDAAANGL